MSRLNYLKGNREYNFSTKVLPHNITIVKHCRPLFGLVKHHVCSRFTMKVKEEGLKEEVNIDPFSSLPPTMTGSSLGLQTFDHEPASMPSSPFLSTLRPPGIKATLSVRDLSEHSGT